MRYVKFKRFIAFLLLCGMSVSCIMGSKVQPIHGAEEVNEYVITTNDAATLNKVKKQYEQCVVDDYKEYDVDEKDLMYAELTESQRRSIKKIDGVLEVEKNIVFSASKSHAKCAVKKKAAKKSNALDWNMKMIGASSDVSKKKAKKDSIKIAIMDSGVDVSEDVNVVERVNLVENEKNIAPYYEDITSHGTSIAGIISDIDPNAKLYSVRVLDSKNTATLDRVIEGIYWSIDHEMDIINMSFGTTYKSAALEKAVDAAYNAGILLVSASGNGGNDERVEYPAAYKNVIAVGGVDRNAVLTNESATGEEIELVAPGSQVLTDGAFGGSLVAGGTSLSVAHVTGAASVIWGKDSSKSNKFIRNLLAVSAKKLGESKLYGNGLVDIKYALQHYDEYSNNASLIDCETSEVVENNFSENLTAVKTFDDVQLVEGRWTSDAHQYLIYIGDQYPGLEVGFTADELLIIKDACAKVDGIFDHGVNEENSINHFRTATQNVLHGRYNYVSTIRYLYRVCRSVYTSAEGTTVASCCNLHSYNPSTGSSSTDTSIRNNLKSAIQYMAAAGTPIANPAGISWQKKRGLRILGMVMHTVGDIYAHKTKVPIRAINDPAVQNAAGASWNEFKKVVQNGMMFNQVEKYLGPGHEDNVNFYTIRFDAAKKASNNILRHFAATFGDIMLDGILMGALIYDGSGAPYEETKLAYLSRHIGKEYNDSGKANSVAPASFTPYTGEY